MKKCITLVFVALLLLLLTACETTTQPLTPEPIPPAETAEPTPPNVPSVDETLPQTYTLEQIQALFEREDMFERFYRMGWEHNTSMPEGHVRVYSVQRVERERDYWFHEAGGRGENDEHVVDLTNSELYRVVVRVPMTNAAYEAFWPGGSGLRREGEVVFLPSYYYFNDVNGEPEFAFLTC